ncbi:MAG: hypothetical protein P8Z35_06700 [Ignavibacteriaceae bacterium]
MKYLTLFLFIISVCVTAQTKTDEEINTAFQHAKKGIYWALANIPEKKSRIKNDLIFEDKLYCKVRLDKKFNGIKIESIGFYNSNQVTILIYKSNDILKEEGFIKLNKENTEKN